MRALAPEGPGDALPVHAPFDKANHFPHIHAHRHLRRAGCVRFDPLPASPPPTSPLPSLGSSAHKDPADRQALLSPARSREALCQNPRFTFLRNPLENQSVTWPNSVGRNHIVSAHYPLSQLCDQVKRIRKHCGISGESSLVPLSLRVGPWRKSVSRRVWCGSLLCDAAHLPCQEENMGTAWS